MSLLLLAAYSLAVFAAALLGALIPRLWQMTHTRTQMMMSLVSGLMLGVALYHLIPHSLGDTGDIDFTMQWVMTGLVFMLLLLRLFHFHQHEFAAEEVCEAAHGHHPGEPEHVHGQAGAADAPMTEIPVLRQGGFTAVGLFIGLGIHTLVDGIALGAVMATDSWGGGLLGVGVFLAILLHKPLDALSIETVMAAAGWPKKKRTQINWIFASLCPLAALIFYVGVDTSVASPLLMPAALAFSAGAFVCIALGDLLPEVQFHSHDRTKLTVLFLSGIALAWGIGLLEGAHY